MSGLHPPADLVAAVSGVESTLAGVRHDLEVPAGLSESDMLAALAALARVRSAVESVYLDVVREIDRAGVAGHRSPGLAGSTAESLVRAATGASASSARRDVAAARATGDGGPLHEVGDLLRSGETTREHLDVAVRVMDRVPAHLVADDESRSTITRFLRETATEAHASPRGLQRAADQLLDRLDPDATRARDPRAQDRRFLDLVTDRTGMLVGSFQLDPVAGAALRAAIDVHSSPAPAGSAGDGTAAGTGRATRGRDPRSARQRRADALAVLAETSLGVASPRRGERPRIVVQTTPQQLAHHRDAGLAVSESGEVLGPDVLSRLACDAVLQRVTVDPAVGPVDVGREHRLVTVAQRRALAVRDGGCVICQAPPDWCDAHHVVPWADGGATNLDNLALVCPHHHTAVHAGVWVLTTDGGRLTVTPPVWVDPRRRPRSPTHHRIREAVARMGPVSTEQERAPTPNPDDDDP